MTNRQNSTINVLLPVADPQVIYKPLSDGGVLFSTADEVYFGLNEVGARVWELLPPVTHTLDELCAAVHSRYPDVDPGMIRADVMELLSELEAAGLVHAAPADST